MSRFEAIGNFVYEKGERIGCTVGEANLELARKLNAYQMRVERLKAEVERLRASSFVTAVPVEEYEKLKAEVERLYRNGDLMLKFAAANMTYPAYATMAKDWLATKEGKPSV